MRSRLTSLFLVAPLMASGVALLDAAPAAAEDAGVCTYKTKKVDKEFKKRNLKIQLELTVQPVTDELRAQLQRIPSDEGERVEGLGDEAYATKFDDVIAISDTTAVQAKLQNYQGSPT